MLSTTGAQWFCPALWIYGLNKLFTSGYDATFATLYFGLTYISA